MSLIYSVLQVSLKPNKVSIRADQKVIPFTVVSNIAVTGNVGVRVNFLESGTICEFLSIRVQRYIHTVLIIVCVYISMHTEYMCMYSVCIRTVPMM